MNDDSSLRALLSRVDGTAPAIQKAAGAMMKHYDRSPGVAVAEWRNALQNAALPQLLPLLYVANEVLQISKRNRGNKFLEAMSPVLGQSLQYICQTDPNVVEKVRRTTKIWGERRVFSVRFVNELLQGLEPYRVQNQQPHPGFSPQHESSSQDTGKPQPQPQSSQDTASSTGDDEIQNILDGHGATPSDDDGDDDDIFANDDSQSQKLSLEINLGSVLQEASSSTMTTTTQPSSPQGRSGNAKRRRSSMSSSNDRGGGGGAAARKRRSVLSTNHLVDMWTHLTELQQRMDTAQTFFRRLNERHGKLSDTDLSNMVGDELQQAVKQNEKDLLQQQAEKRHLHAIAVDRHLHEEEAIKYLTWLERGLRQDDDDLQFCDMLEQKILSFKDIHASCREARSVRQAEERKLQQEQEERDRLLREREEQEKFKQEALKKETEAKPGMVWNPTTREYQALNTEETWRE